MKKKLLSMLLAVCVVVSCVVTGVVASATAETRSADSNACNHEWVWWRWGEQGHAKLCSVCFEWKDAEAHGYVTVNGKTYCGYEPLSSTGNAATLSVSEEEEHEHEFTYLQCGYAHCWCGHYEYGTNHAWSWQILSSAQHCKQCIYCGITGSYENHGWYTSGGSTYCGSCGYPKP